MTNSLMEPLPGSTRRLLSRNTHPGLMLDKYAQSWDPTEQLNKLSEKVQGPTIESVVNLTRAASQDFYRSILGRRNNVLAELGVLTFEATNTGPLTLHLARASALENAGICLHRLYGFTYLPGTSLKGLARAYAETVWFPGQFETSESGAPGDNLELQRAAAAWQKIESVFGHSPGSDHGKGWKPKAIPKHSAADSASAGGVVFHDAWPLSWPPLIKDILNCHHPEYYRAAQPPGDWEDPIPVYFLAVPAGQRFQFAIGRRGQRDEELTALATEWLVGALTSLGVGAKTNSGYGSFQVISPPEPLKHLPAAAQATWETALANRRVAELKATLTLVTPAFLAGASQQAEDCDLRPATLRGLLRWWWRTMHAAHIDPSMLASLESAVWGDTSRGGAIRLTLEPISTPTPLLYDKQWLSDNNALPKPANNKTTQGLWYHSFGMDDKRKEDGRASRQQRYYIVPGTQWQLKLTARTSSFEVRNRQGKTMRSVPLTDPRGLLQQAQCALWLLCNFGGVGSKSRKGFGSLAVPDGLCDWSVEQCRQIAAAFRQSCQVPSGAPGGSPALEDMLTIEDTPTPWTNYWYALDQLAASVQQFAQDYKHNAEKKALGMPRSLRRPVGGSFQPGPHVQKTGRHASPVIYHLAPGRNGLVVRVVAFPSAELPHDPTRQKSRRFLQLFLDHLSRQLPIHVEQQGNPGRTPAQNPAPRAASQQSSSASVSQPAKATPYPKSGEAVEATLVEDPKGKGRRFAEYEPLHAVGAIINAADVPEELKPGDRVTLLVHSITPAGDGSIKAIQFNWPT
ncbi:MAG: type III-B CRISPR module RAMP protein Cmr6, partial [Planctomycetota bacterium]|nr:type III-B CRISPR module RAMP protein Cmr6 [Planctomycetota bacterium]